MGDSCLWAVKSIKQSRVKTAIIRLMKDNPYPMDTLRELIARVRAVGLDLGGFVEQGLLDIECVVETEMETDEYLYRVCKRLDMHGYRRVGIDSLNALERMSSTAVFAADAIVYLVRILIRSSVTPMLRYEMPVVTAR